MWEKAFQPVLTAFALIAAVVSIVQAQNDGLTTDAATKKAQAIALFEAKADPILPAWGVTVFNALCPALIDMAVTFANSTGFFKHSATSGG